MQMTLRIGRKRVVRWLIGPLAVLLIALSPECAKASQTGPADVIKIFNATLLETMKRAEELGYPGRYKLLEPVIKDSFALSFMAKQSVGRYGKTFSEVQRNLLEKTYADWSIATYAGRFDSYAGEKFEVVSESGPVQGTVTVVSKLIRSNKEEIDFYYMLQKKEDKWQIVDIQISGVSQLALTKSQFLSVLRDKGLDGLIAMLKEKIKGFSQGKEK